MRIPRRPTRTVLLGMTSVAPVETWDEKHLLEPTSVAPVETRDEKHLLEPTSVAPVETRDDKVRWEG